MNCLLTMMMIRLMVILSDDVVSCCERKENLEKL